MICLGVVSGISWLALGYIVKWVDTLISMVFGFTLHAGLILWFLFWDANPDKRIIFYITSGLWGICHSIWSVETSGKFLFNLVLVTVTNCKFFRRLFNTLQNHQQFSPWVKFLYTGKKFGHLEWGTLPSWNDVIGSFYWLWLLHPGAEQFLVSSITKCVLYHGYF